MIGYSGTPHQDHSRRLRTIDVHVAGRDGRAHTFNGNYGMFRGITSAAIVAAIAIVLVRGWATWPITTAFLTTAGLALFRMHRFATHYARETFVQFLALTRANGGTS